MHRPIAQSCNTRNEESETETDARAVVTAKPPFRLAFIENSSLSFEKRLTACLSLFTRVSASTCARCNKKCSPQFDARLTRLQNEPGPSAVSQVSHEQITWGGGRQDLTDWKSKVVGCALQRYFAVDSTTSSPPPYCSQEVQSSINTDTMARRPARCYRYCKNKVSIFACDPGKPSH
jgi:hypothetical protein